MAREDRLTTKDVLNACLNQRGEPVTEHGFRQWLNGQSRPHQDQIETNARNIANTAAGLGSRKDPHELTEKYHKALWDLRQDSPTNKKAPVEPEGTTEAVASQDSPPEANSPAACPISDFLREWKGIIDAGWEAHEAVESSREYWAWIEALGPVTAREQRSRLRGVLLQSWHWQGLHQETARTVEKHADRLLEIDEDIERLKLPENLIEAAFRLDHLEEIRPQEARLLELRDGLQSIRRLAMEGWAAVADWLRLETEVALYKRALADMSGQERVEQVKSKVVRSMDEEQAQLFLAATHGERWETLWLVALQTGMRPEEYQGLFWTDFDFARHTCHIQRALVRPTGGAWKLEETKTQSGDRVIRIDPRLVAELKKHRARQAQERLLAGPEWDGTHPFVFTNERGGPVNHCNLARRSFKPLIKKAGLPDKFCPYDLRHTFATLMLKSGEDIKTVSEVLGHKDIQITLSFYHHCLPKMHHDAATRAADLFSPPANPAHLSRTDRTKRAKTGGDG